MLLKGMANNHHRHITESMEQGIDEQPDLSVKNAAKSLQVSSSFLYSHWGADLTPKQFLLKKRFEKAVSLLAYGKKINQIAQELKFCDHIYFSKWFKQYCGISPKQFQVKYGTCYKDGNYEKIDNDIKRETPNMPVNFKRTLFSFILGLLFIFVTKATWAFEVNGFVKIPAGCPIESVLVYSPEQPETIRVGLQLESVPYYSYHFDPINMDSTYVIQAMGDSFWDFYVDNWLNDETLGSKVFDLAVNQPTAQIYQIASIICAGEQGMTFFLPRNQRKIITSCLNPTPNRGELWNFYSVQIGDLSPQPFDTAIVRAWRRDLDIWAETTITSVWDVERFGPYVWSLLGGIFDSLNLNLKYTPYYFRINNFSPKSVIGMTEFTPQIVLINDSMFGRDYIVSMNIGESYSATKNDHLADAFTFATYDTVSFSPLSLAPGIYPVVCTLFTSIYQSPFVFYDTILSMGSNVPGWNKKKDIFARKMVKFGSDLTYFSPLKIYAFTGNGTHNFVRYDILADTWARCESIPNAPELRKKKVKRGCALTNDGVNSIYAVKGNNSCEFWRYDIDGDTWHYLNECPCGVTPKGKSTHLKNGADLVFVRKGDSSLVFLLFGSKTFCFKAYYVEGDTWVNRTDVLSAPSEKPMAEGSCLAYDDARFIYALKGKYGDFYRYDIYYNSWVTMSPLPLIKKKRYKDGTALAYDGLGRIFATKGNTNEFWSYTIRKDTWQQLTAPTEIKKLKGGSVCFAAAANTFYLLEGNKTNNFWAYVPEPATALGEERLKSLPDRLPTTVLKKGSFLPKGYLAVTEKMQIYNMLGRRLGIVNEKTKLNFPSGLYFIKCGAKRFKLILID